MKFHVIYQRTSSNAQSPVRLVEQATGREVGWINRYLDREYVRRLADTTLRIYAHELLHFLRWWESVHHTGDIAENDLSESTLLEYVRFQSGQQPRPSASTINHRTAVVDRALRNDFPDAPCQIARGFHQAFLRRGPMGLGRPRMATSRVRVKAAKRTIVPLSVQEVARFWSSFRTSRDLAIVGLMLLQGLRSAEVLALNRDDSRRFLDELIPFLEGPVLADGELERMFAPGVSSEAAPLWEHCQRAIEHGWKLGPHGLPLIGNGDWNDGMNLVGAKGQGESVWLGWFLCTVLEAFSQIWEPRDREARMVPEWRQKAAWMKNQVEQTAWDGEWYLRGFFDNGSPLGSHANEEAQIDSLPQSWSVISGAGARPRARQAMESAERNLVREKEKLVLLLAPPFNRSEPNPGYIMGYPPGLRENGGQYTHGALWLAMAWARMDDGDRAVRLLQMMNPVELKASQSRRTEGTPSPNVAAQPPPRAGSLP